MTIWGVGPEAIGSGAQPVTITSMTERAGMQTSSVMAMEAMTFKPKMELETITFTPTTVDPEHNSHIARTTLTTRGTVTRAAPSNPSHRRDFSDPNRLYLSMSTDETALAVRKKAASALQGDERLASLYEQFMPGALRLSVFLTRDSLEGEELAQDAFVSVVGRFHDRGGPDNFEAYLTRTVINLAARRGRRVSREVDLRSTTPVSLIDMENSSADRDLLWRGIRQLPPRQRAVLYLRYHEDLPEREVAQMLDCSLSAVKSLTLRATRRLETMLSERTDG